MNVDHLPSGQLHSVPLHSDSCTGVRLAHGRRTYACVPDLCACAGLTHGRRTYARALDLGTGAGLMYGRRTYAEAPDLCAGAGLMHRHMILISYRESIGSY